MSWRPVRLRLQALLIVWESAWESTLGELSK